MGVRRRVWIWPLLIAGIAVAVFLARSKPIDYGFRMEPIGRPLRYISKAELLRGPVIDITFPLLGRVVYPNRGSTLITDAYDADVAGYLVSDRQFYDLVKWRIGKKEFAAPTKRGAPIMVSIAVPYAPSDGITKAELVIGNRSSTVTLPRFPGPPKQPRKPIRTPAGKFTIIAEPGDTVSRLAPVFCRLRAEPSDRCFFLDITRNYFFTSSKGKPTLSTTPINHTLWLLNRRSEAFWFLRYNSEQWKGTIYEVTQVPIKLKITGVRKTVPEVHLASGEPVFTAAGGLKLIEGGFVAIKLERGYVEPDYGKRSQSTVYFNSLAEGAVVDAYGLKVVHAEPFQFELPRNWD